jgi:hypothetical protein
LSNTRYCTVKANTNKPDNSFLLYTAIGMLGLWLFAEGFGPGAQMMVYPS